MFKKTFIFFFFSLFMYANQITSAVIDKVEQGYVYAHIVDNNLNLDELKNGAFIVKDIGKHSIIVARANFVSFENNVLKLELYTFSDLKQTALPLPVLAPQIGDKVILNNYIKYTMLIAPSKQDYEMVQNNFKDFIYFDTNVFAANLYSSSLIIPSRNDLRDFCKTWVVGSIMYVAEDSINLYECSSLKKIASFEYKVNKNENINFYSNISKQLSKTTDYFSYYNELFKEKE